MPSKITLELNKKKEIAEINNNLQKNLICFYLRSKSNQRLMS